MDQIQMNGLHFRVHKPLEASAPNRVDIACFVGLIGYRHESSTEYIRQTEIGEWLYKQGWLNKNEKLPATYHRPGASVLLDVPIPIESWEIFDSLFAWDERLMDDRGTKSDTYLGAAVRSFFAQGGRKCYVIRTGDPLRLNAAAAEREAKLSQIIPGYPAGVVGSSRSDRTTWRGVGHLFGLPDISFLCLPDLPDLLQSETPRIPVDRPAVQTPGEQFVLCSEPSAPPPEDIPVAGIPAPRCDADGFDKWQIAIHTVAQFLATHRREIQLVAGIPLPDPTLTSQNNLLEFMHAKNWLSNEIDSSHSLASVFVQLCFPWLQTVASDFLPQRLETPDGALVGLLARNALTRGTFRSATALTQSHIVNLIPELQQDDIYALNPEAPADASPGAGLVQRVSLFGSTPQGIQLLSDVTTSNSVIYRPASISRIISLVVKAARRAGEDFVFESSGERLWARLRGRLTDLLQTLFTVGALRGATPADAYQVRCDRSVMTQRDIDAGRVIAHILIQPAASIETIDVLLSMGNGGQVSLSSLGMQELVS